VENNNNNLFGPEKMKENYQENFPVTIAAGTRLYEELPKPQ
jgi:hypothetical protein